MQINVYDVHHDEEAALPVNMIDNESFNDFKNGSVTSFEFDGTTWNVSRSENGIELNGNTYVNSFDYVESLVEAMGITANLQSSGNFNDADSFEYTGLYDYRKEDDSTVYPAIQFTKTANAQHPGYYSYNIKLIDENHNTWSDDYFQDDYRGPSYGYCMVTSYLQGNLDIYGYISVNGSTAGLQHTTRIKFHRTQGTITSVDYVATEESPGDEGFKPKRVPNNDNRGGGNRSGAIVRYISDILEKAQAPDESAASVVASGCLNIYQVDPSNLDNLLKCLFSDTFLGWLNNLFMNPLDSLVSLSIFPCAPDLGGSEPIKLYKYSCNSASLGANAYGTRLSKQYKHIPFGRIYASEMFESYLDYVGTSFLLYLPFIGEVEIPVAEVMGGFIDLDYTIDFATGACVANVQCEKHMAINGVLCDTQFTNHSYQGNCSAQLPLTSVSYSNIVGSLLNCVSTGLASGPCGAGVSLMKDGLSGGFAPTISTKGSVTANGGFCSILYPYITIFRPITAEPDNFQTVMGYPSYMDKSLATCHGLCICDNIDLHGVTGATDNEINRIKQMCREGVYV